MFMFQLFSTSNAQNVLPFTKPQSSVGSTCTIILMTPAYTIIFTVNKKIVIFELKLKSTLNVPYHLSLKISKAITKNGSKQ